MSYRVLNVFLGLGLIACLGLVWTAGRDYSRPNVEFLPEMVHSLAYETFAPNPNFPDGKTLQPPPAGTIARGLMPLHYESTPEEAARAGRELKSPLDPDDPQVAERGAFVFSAFCQQCHGPAGEGDGPVARRGFPPPASLLADSARQMKDGEIFHALTYGKGNMPSHAAQLSRADRWRAVAHVRALQSRPPPATQPTTQPATQPQTQPGGDPTP